MRSFSTNISPNDSILPFGSVGVSGETVGVGSGGLLRSVLKCRLDLVVNTPLRTQMGFKWDVIDQYRYPLTSHYTFDWDDGEDESPTTVLGGSLQLDYRIEFATQQTIRYGDSVVSLRTLPSGDMPRIQAQQSAPYGDMPSVTCRASIQYGDCPRVGSDLGSRYGDMPGITATLLSLYGETGQQVSSLTAPYHLLTTVGKRQLFALEIQQNKEIRQR